MVTPFRFAPLPCHPGQARSAPYPGPTPRAPRSGGPGSPLRRGRDDSLGLAFSLPRPRPAGRRRFRARSTCTRSTPRPTWSRNWWSTPACRGRPGGRSATPTPRSMCWASRPRLPSKLEVDESVFRHRVDGANVLIMGQEAEVSRDAVRRPGHGRQALPLHHRQADALGPCRRDLRPGWKAPLAVMKKAPDSVDEVEPAFAGFPVANAGRAAIVSISLGGVTERVREIAKGKDIDKRPRIQNLPGYSLVDAIKSLGSAPQPLQGAVPGRRPAPGRERPGRDRGHGRALGAGRGARGGGGRSRLRAAWPRPRPSPANCATARPTRSRPSPRPWASPARPWR